MQGNEIQILYIVLAIMLFILMGLVTAVILLKIKSKINTQSMKYVAQEEKVSTKTKVQQKYDIKSVFNFMEFDKIEDNMIVQKNGKRFLMVIKCQGVNYDLMSEMEKTGVEQGFIQYLNTLRYPVQIYIQTRTVDLGDSIKTYKEKIKVLGDNLAQKEFEYNQKVRQGNVDAQILAKEKFEVIKSKNLYEYGVDVVNNTERMSLNKNILSKEYYIIIPYYPEELNSGDYAKEEITNAAFAELYTRAQSTINLLAVCGINSKILDSVELANLLYRAYNRDESEIYDLQKALNAGFDEMYITAPDVLDRRMKALDKQIEQEAIKKANEVVLQVKEESEKERELREKEEELESLIADMSKVIIENNRAMLGNDIVEKAKERIDSNKTEEEVQENVQKKVRRTRSPRKTA